MDYRRSIPRETLTAVRTGTVAAVSIDRTHRFSKMPRLSVILIAGRGIEGDAHSGPFVKHRYLARRDPRTPNLRQVHLIPRETLAALHSVGYEIEPGELGENITTAGLELESLPLHTELRIGASARVLLTGLRTPCILIDRFRPGLKNRLVTGNFDRPFKAGVMAVVTGSGEVGAGDAVQAVLPATPHQPLPAI